jgi:hypothetical protein
VPSSEPAFGCIGSREAIITCAIPRARPVVPMHRGDLPPGTLRAIIGQSGLSVDEFLDLL